MRVAFLTHGCRSNQAESDAIAGQLVAAGHAIVDALADADAIVLNSCTITHAADADARRQLRSLKARHPAARVIATGCWATDRPDEARALGADLVVGNADKDRLIDLLRVQSPTPIIAVSALTRRRPSALPSAPSPTRARALLRVQDGCDYRCAYCIVPKVRGPSRSWPIEIVTGELDALVASGVPEIVLTGIHLGTWGRDLRPKRRLTDLVAALVPRLGGARLRISSVDPHEVDDALLDLIAAHPDRLCRHLHLPVQSVDDGVLRRMRRGHDAHTFAALVQHATARVPGLAIGTDVIVGFPGESADAFTRTHARLAALPLSYLHVFSYSERHGTAAATMSGSVARSDRALRNRTLRKLSHAMSERFRRALAGQLVDLVVHRRPDAHGDLVGLTDHYVRLRVPSDTRPGTRVRARVDATATFAAPVS